MLEVVVNLPASALSFLNAAKSRSELDGQNAQRAFLLYIETLKNTLSTRECNTFVVLEHNLKTIDILQSRAAVESGLTITCTKGCSFCCSMPDIQLTTAEFELITKKQGEQVLKAAVKEPSSYCPFLENNLCSIYDHRPFSCRLWNSTDPVTKCHSRESNVRLVCHPKAILIATAWFNNFETEDIRALLKKFNRSDADLHIM